MGFMVRKYWSVCDTRSLYWCFQDPRIDGLQQECEIYQDNKSYNHLVPLMYADWRFLLGFLQIEKNQHWCICLPLYVRWKTSATQLLEVRLKIIIQTTLLCKMEDIKHTISVGKMGHINNTTYVSKMGDMTHTITPGKLVDINHTTLWFCW